MKVEHQTIIKIGSSEYFALKNDALLRYLFIALAIVFGTVVAVSVAKVGVLALLIIPAFIGFIGVLNNPWLGLSILIFTIYINLSPVLVAYFGLPSIAQPFVVFLSIILLIRIILFRDHVLGLQLPIILVGMYTLIGMLTLLYARDFTVGYAALIDYLKDALYSILIVAFIQKPKALRSAIWALLIAGILLSSVSLYQQFTGTFLNEYWGYGQSVTSGTGTGYRLGGPIGDPNYYAMFLVALIPLAIERFWHEKSAFLRLLSGWVVAACTLTVLYTYSRGGFLALICTVVLFAIRFRRQLRFIPVVLSISILFVVFQFLPAKYTDRVTTLLSFLPQSGGNPLADSSIRGRTSANLVAIQMFVDHPIVGVGIANYDSNYYSYARPMGIDPSSVGGRQAHNLYLQIASERGLLGLLAFAILLFVTFKTILQTEVKLNNLGMEEYASLSTAISVSLVGYLVASIFLHDAYFRYFWVLIGIAWSFPQIVFHEVEDVERSL